MKRGKYSFLSVLFFLVETGIIACIAGELAASKLTPQLLAPPRNHFRNYIPSCFQTSETMPEDIMPNCRDRIIAQDFNISFNTNNMGFRDDDVEEKKEDEFRIVVVGDSFTAGWGVEQNEAFPNVLQAILNDRLTGAGKYYNVINAGYQARTFDTYYLFLKNEGMALDPDLVVVTIWLGNDLMELYSDFWDKVDERGLPLKIDGYNRIKENHQLVFRYVPFKYRRWPLNRSHLFLVMAGIYEYKIKKGRVTSIMGEFNDESREKYKRDVKILEQFHNSLGPGISEEEVDGCDMLPYPDGRPEYGRYTWMKTVAMVKAITELAGENETDIYFMNIPVKTYDRKQGCHLRLIRKLLRNMGVPLLDLNERFELGSGKIDQTYYYKQDGHFMPEGQRIMAEEMYKDFSTRILHAGKSR